VALALFEQGADFTEQDVGVDWLGQVAVDAEPEPALAVLGDRQNDDRNVERLRIVAQHGGDVEPVHLGHHHVEHDQVGTLSAHFGDRLAPVRGGHDGIAGFGKLLRQQLADPASVNLTALEIRLMTT